MLTHTLAWILGLGSLSLFGIAFIFPEIYRPGDRIWGGIGLFYALMLWVSSDHITTGLFLGQSAGVALIFWLGLQTMQQRQALCPHEAEPPDSDSLPGRIRKVVVWVWERLSWLKDRLTHWAEVGVDQLPKQVTKLMGLFQRPDPSVDQGVTNGGTPPPTTTSTDDPWDEDEASEPRPQEPPMAAEEAETGEAVAEPETIPPASPPVTDPPPLDSGAPTSEQAPVKPTSDSDADTPETDTAEADEDEVVDSTEDSAVEVVTDTVTSETEANIDDHPTETEISSQTSAELADTSDLKAKDIEPTERDEVMASAPEIEPEQSGLEQEHGTQPSEVAVNDDPTNAVAERNLKGAEPETTEFTPEPEPESESEELEANATVLEPDHEPRDRGVENSNTGAGEHPEDMDGDGIEGETETEAKGPSANESWPPPEPLD